MLGPIEDDPGWKMVLQHRSVQETIAAHHAEFSRNKVGGPFASNEGVYSRVVAVSQPCFETVVSWADLCCVLAVTSTTGMVRRHGLRPIVPVVAYLSCLGQDWRRQGISCGDLR